MQRVGTHALFGSWDEGLTTERRGDRWVAVGDETALKNVSWEMAGLVEQHQRFTDQAHRYSTKKKDETMAEVGRLLGED